MKILKNKNTYTKILQLCFLCSVVTLAACKRTLDDKQESYTTTPEKIANSTEEPSTLITEAMIQEAVSYPFLANVLMELRSGNKTHINDTEPTPIRPNKGAGSLLGFTALHYAALLGHGNMIKVLWTLGANTAAKDLYDRTPLHYAAEQGKSKAVQALCNTYYVSVTAPNRLCLESVSDVNASDAFGQTALTIATAQGYLEIVQLLLHHPLIEVNKPDHTGQTALNIAIAKEYFEIVQLLLSHPLIEVNSIRYDYKILQRLAEHMNIETLRKLLSHPGIDPNVQDCASGYTLLHWAAEQGNLAVLEQLLCNPATHVHAVTTDGATALHIATLKGHLGVVKLLLGHSLIGLNDQNQHGSTPLFLAACSGHTSILAYLLQYSETDVNKPDRIGNTALHIAAFIGHVGIVELLLKHPLIEVNKPGNAALTALDMAVARSHFEIVQLLLSHPLIEVNSIRYDYKILQRLAEHTNIEALRKLLSHPGIDPNVQDRASGYTLLHWAAEQGNFSRIRTAIVQPSDSCTCSNHLWCNSFAYSHFQGPFRCRQAVVGSFPDWVK